MNGIRGRKILRVHVGSPIECDYKLRSFGIPTDDIPRTHTHSIKLKNHMRLLKVRKTIDSFREQAMATNGYKNVTFPHIECPQTNCILFGRYAWDHPGNIEFRGLIQELATAQENRDRNEAMHDGLYCMNKRLIQEALSRNFRFLMYDRETLLYKEATEYGDIRKLVEQSVREHRKRVKAKRMINEIKAKNGKKKNNNSMEDVSKLSSVLSTESEGGGVAGSAEDAWDACRIAVIAKVLKAAKFLDRDSVMCTVPLSSAATRCAVSHDSYHRDDKLRRLT